jgi:hypothetical protein
VYCQACMCDPINRYKRSNNPQIISGATLTRHNILAYKSVVKRQLTATVSVQRLRKHVPTAANTHATVKLLLETGCFLCGPCRIVIR